MPEHVIRIEVAVSIAGNGDPVVRVISREDPAMPAPEPKPSAAPEALPQDDWNTCQARYLEWGAAMGGKKGRPWNPRHVSCIRVKLDWWRERLGADRLGQIRLDAVESLLAQNRRKTGENGQTGFAPATLKQYRDALKAFWNWAHKRSLVAGESPFLAASPMHSDPERIWRALTPEETARLLASAPAPRALVYAIAMSTALRANELRQLTTDHLDVPRRGLRLNAEWTKNRKEGFQVLPGELVLRLAEAGASKPSGARLLDVPQNPARDLKKDLKRARIAEETPEGVVVFHALRTTAITLFEESGATDAEVKAFGRHATSRASERYRRTRQDNLRRLQELTFNRIQGRYSVPRFHTTHPEPQKQPKLISVAGADNWYPHGDLNPGLQAENALETGISLQLHISPEVVVQGRGRESLAGEVHSVAEEFGLLTAWWWQQSRERQRALLEALGISGGSATDGDGQSAGLSGQLTVRE